MSEIAISFHFIKGPFVELHGSGEEEYDVEFIDTRTSQTVFSTKLKPGQWARANRRWFTNWNVRVSRAGSLYLDHRFDCCGKRVYIALDSNCLGDNIAWIPIAREFARKHACRVIVSTFFNDLFRDQYPELTFVQPGDTVHDLYAMYEIGCYSPPWGGPREMNPVDYRTIPLQRVASDILGLDFVEVQPSVNVFHTLSCDPDRFGTKYVCLSEHSTAGAKLWQYPGGWQRVVDFLNDRDYAVVVISKEKTQLRNVIDLTGDFPLLARAHALHHAKMFIGLGSGLTWLAWAVNTPVILIAGFSALWAEFSTGLIKLQNQQVCHGCWNDTRFEFDKGDWNWCPNHKGTDRQFECSKSILPEAVFEAILAMEQPAQISDHRLNPWFRTPSFQIRDDVASNVSQIL
jgi:autotransporter strand-loop-strand O-heptosyltransferase